MKTTPAKMLNRAIRDPKGIWYGPHQCNKCGGVIVKKSFEQGGLELNAPQGSCYPNHKWELHDCGKEL